MRDGGRVGSGTRWRTHWKVSAQPSRLAVSPDALQRSQCPVGVALDVVVDDVRQLGRVELVGLLAAVPKEKIELLRCRSRVNKLV